MTLREKFELMELSCDADHRTRIHDKYITRYGIEPYDLTLEEVLGDYEIERLKLGGKARKFAA